MLDEPGVISKKFRRAVTDSGSEIVRAADKPGITNLLEILAVARGVAPDAIERDFEGRGYGDLKVAVGDEVAAWLAPVRERYEELRGDDARLEGVLAEGVLAEGAEKARAIATGTLADVRRGDGVRTGAAVRRARDLACSGHGLPRHTAGADQPAGAGPLVS